MESDFVQAGQSRLQYYQQGNGPETVVLVHGYASSAALWRLTIEKLGLDEKFRVIAINNRGAGDSSRSTSEAGYTVETFAFDLFNAVQVLGLRDFTLVGHSMGGATVTRFSLEHQDLLKALVLVNVCASFVAALLVFPRLDGLLLGSLFLVEVITLVLVSGRIRLLAMGQPFLVALSTASSAATCWCCCSC